MEETYHSASFFAIYWPYILAVFFSLFMTWRIFRANDTSENGLVHTIIALVMVPLLIFFFFHLTKRLLTGPATQYAILDSATEVRGRKGGTYTELCFAPQGAKNCQWGVRIHGNLAAKFRPHINACHEIKIYFRFAFFVGDKLASAKEMPNKYCML